MFKVSFKSALLAATALAVCTFAVYPAARAQFYQYFDGNNLHAVCQSPSESAAHLECDSYIHGVMDAGTQKASLARQKQGKTVYTGHSDSYWCVPPGVTTPQIVDVITQDLRNHPEYRHALAAGLIDNALMKIWPFPLEYQG